MLGISAFFPSSFLHEFINISLVLFLFEMEKVCTFKKNDWKKAKWADSPIQTQNFECVTLENVTESLYVKSCSCSEPPKNVYRAKMWSLAYWR